MRKVAAINGEHLPRDLANYLLEHEGEIKNAILIVTLNDKMGTTKEMFTQSDNSDIAFAAISLIASVVAQMRVVE